jgi:DNA-binding MarR family transcriptional regulator
MTTKKEHESMENLDKVYNLVQQSSAKGGTNATTIGEKLGMHRTTVHKHLNSLELMGKVESQHGLWVTKTGEQTIKPLEKEIIIELPMPKNKWFDVARLQVHANYMQGIGFSGVADIDKTIIEKFNETRRIKITAKNVSDLDIEKVSNLILEANEKSAKVSFKRILKSVKIPQLNNGKNSVPELNDQSEEQENE